MTQAETLGFKTTETTELVNQLNKLLANYQVHYQKLRNFHWNVTGADFFELHEQFEQEYNTVKVVIDVLAERIRIFGSRPFSTFQEYLEHSTITEQPNKLSSEEMVAEIIADFEQLLSCIVTCQELAGTAEEEIA